jgi:hypothetical protein
MAVVELGIVPQIVRTQPDAVKRALAADPFSQASSTVWTAMAAAAILLGAAAGFSRIGRTVLPWAALLVAVARTGAMALFRDVLRDQTLLAKGYDVWQRSVVTNWGVVVLFLVTFVAGLGAVGWLISVVARAERVMEKTA